MSSCYREHCNLDILDVTHMLHKPVILAAELLCCEQVPPITNYNVSDGQTYRYMSVDPLYPFGYGLSYTKFHYSYLIVSPATIKHGENVTVTVSVTNRGPYEADEVFFLLMFK